MLDIFTEPVSLTYNGKEREYRTKVGACMTILMMISLVSYGARKMVTMYSYSDARISSHIDFNEIGETYLFNTSDTEFSLAFGLTQYPVTELIDLDDYGTFVASYTVLSEAT